MRNTTMNLTSDDTSYDMNSDGSLSRLELLHREYLAKYKGRTSKARVLELVQRYLARRRAKLEQEEAMLRAAQDESLAAEDLVREACGKSRVTIDGVPYIPMSRGTRVFFRKDMTDYVDLTDTPTAGRA